MGKHPLWNVDPSIRGLESANSVRIHHFSNDPTIIISRALVEILKILGERWLFGTGRRRRLHRFCQWPSLHKNGHRQNHQLGSWVANLAKFDFIVVHVLGKKKHLKQHLTSEPFAICDGRKSARLLLNHPFATLDLLHNFANLPSIWSPNTTS